MVKGHPGLWVPAMDFNDSSSNILLLDLHHKIITYVDHKPQGDFKYFKSYCEEMMFVYFQ